jgi:hypothetical protein
MSVNVNRILHQMDSHVRRRHRPCWGKEENYADEDDPGDGNDIDRGPPSSQCERPLDEFHPVFVDLMGQNYRDVRQIKRRRSDVENRRGRLGRSDGDTIQTDAEENHEPDGIDWGMRIFVHVSKSPWQRSAISMAYIVWRIMITGKTAVPRHGRMHTPFSCLPASQNSR